MTPGFQCLTSIRPALIKSRSTSTSRLLSLSNSKRSSSSAIQSASDRVQRVIFSGIQPTGVPHIGNYVGALKNWVQLQNQNVTRASKAQLFYSIVGLHAITLPQSPEKLRQERFEMMCTLLAIGLDPKHCCLFNQDEVPAHSELAWILNCITPVGRLNRMTTWKSRLATARNSNSLEEVDDSMLHLGLLAYPVLQSADILLYKSTHIPVGQDQEQHIELTRMIAKSFNKQFQASLFPIPRAIYTPQARILNLRNPDVKMSKSHPSATSRILITDSPDQIRSKIQSAVTDSISHITYDPIQRPGVSNLIDIHAGFADQSVTETVTRFEGKMAGDLKSELIDLLINHLSPIRQEYERLRQAKGDVEEIFRCGALQATSVANQTLREVKKAVGFL
ncbi:hypothetical protein CROQUDRAFT_46320 [Cronartium quercuum f. sp. fusiforme G11]|uniref:Tryptophan--tRNA ligase, mitochondrial n=1 Tax=Cronartium quercuum f. sp. fusiforme G11 TaxID=708437 RepID=A0A9P6NJ29_9BASI|nr:hypothetical protein CROQUDRAFT_46320 [Cronartium quercuum f. sp. fusiforme G11]